LNGYFKTAEQGNQFELLAGFCLASSTAGVPQRRIFPEGAVGRSGGDGETIDGDKPGNLEIFAGSATITYSLFASMSCLAGHVANCNLSANLHQAARLANAMLPDMDGNPNPNVRVWSESVFDYIKPAGTARSAAAFGRAFDSGAGWLKIASSQ
jgi:hypothetical protein